MAIDRSSLDPAGAGQFWRQKEAESAIADDLRAFLDLAWSQRVDQKTKTVTPYIDAYGIYSRGGYAPGFDLVQTKQFLRQLATLPAVPEIQASAQDRGLGQLLVSACRAYPVASGFISMPASEFQRLVDEAQQDDAFATLLSRTFYHFRQYVGGSSRRIYLHAKPAFGPEVMRFLLGTVVQIHGVSNAKVAPPSSMERYDMIVIYLADDAGVNAALAKIAEYQARNRGLFEHGTPRLLKPIPEFKGVPLVGVATGAEPRFDLVEFDDGSIRVVDQASSFGTVRSAIINYCLKWTVKSRQDKAYFVSNVVRIMRNFGFDPRAPYNG